MKAMKRILGVLALILIAALHAGDLNAQTVKAPEFSYNELGTSKKVGLADFKGKYVLIDFWASWCPPCHAAVPFLKEAYSKYKSKGFEILGVSLDKNQAAWEKAVKSKELNWPQVRTNDEGASVTKLYSFNSIPFFVLVDPEGNIVAKGFQAKELDKILAETIR